MKKKIIGILLAVTLTVSQAGIVVYAEDVTWEDEFTQMDEADESETPEADVAWDGESEISETEDDEEQVEVTEEDTEAGVEETNTETEESPVSEEESLFSDGVGELFSSGDTIVYDADEMEPFKSRTLKEVADEYAKARYAGATYSNSDSSTWYQEPCSTSAPYAAGVLTQDTHTAMTAMTNFYRWLSGLNSLKNSSTHSDSLQVQALVRNFEFSHWVSDSSKPADMSDEMWNAGAPCRHNILARGYTPQGAITGWMNEGYSLRSQSWDTTGHRYALIEASLSDVQYGFSGGIAIGAGVASGNTSDLPFSAFPAPGYMPSRLVSPSSSAWSVRINKNTLKIADSTKVTAVITNLNTGNSYECTKENGKLRVSGVEIDMVQPSDYSGSRYTDSYRVQITGLQDAATGSEAQISYTTRFADITEEMPSYVTSVTADAREYVIYKTMDNIESIKKVAAILPKQVWATAESGKKIRVSVKGEWEINEADKCFVNSADPSGLPENITDKNHLLDEVKVPYKISDDYYDSYNTLYISPQKVKEGENIELGVYRTNISTDTSQIYKLTAKEDGTYSAVKKYDSSESPEFDKEASDASVYSATHIYKKSGVTLDDAGEYISVYYSSSSQSRIYVCRATKTLEVEHTHTWDEGKITKASTCTKKGTKTFTCTVCGKTRNQEVSVVAHKFTTWKTTTAATALAPAKQTHKCSTCGKTETRNYGNKLKPSIKVNISSILLKTSQKTTLLRVSGLAKGDSIVSWKSSNTNIAKVYGRSNGTCTIQAGTRSGKAIITIALRSGLKKNITVTVQKTTVKTTKITGVATSLKLKRNQKATLKPVLQPLTSGEKITYKSSNTKIAIVNSKGQITARSKGTATITVTSGRKSVRCKVIVN
ncbi:Ig-like domain-containing protein [Blautia obeum]|uniref:Ig-like domain-containing protein n=1 Tax=Blautia obeum TaxID=40520 RepID=UPI001D069192|nr:Ig-like domain-containing protein [Blautia obeum]MCB7342441.1 Ig-like domain-containing protein [Blautia obeum]